MPAVQLFDERSHAEYAHTGADQSVSEGRQELSGQRADTIEPQQRGGLVGLHDRRCHPHDAEGGDSEGHAWGSRRVGRQPTHHNVEGREPSPRRELSGQRGGASFIRGGQFDTRESLFAQPGRGEDQMSGAGTMYIGSGPVERSLFVGCGVGGVAGDDSAAAYAFI